jgi:hypothetical protein
MQVYMPVIPNTRRWRFKEAQLVASQGKQLARPHLNQQGVVLVPICNPSYLGD